ncbi:GDSL-type esterase/lipase family protein [Streptomyces sp. NPDC047024]|uniref:GDSL-type esterase/lipase family protein n=1 Tax=Streptomyces sp. NPDC047024 TaxID=3155476 RepID=UPI0033FF8F04
MSKICIIGNSVAASRTEEEAPLAGWGQYLGEFLTEGYEVRNYARDAMTLRGYFTGRFATLLSVIGPGDLVFVAFGNVEQRINQLNRYHGPREYKEYMRLYVEAIRGEGATPVLFTPAARCTFDEAGNVVNTHDAYPDLTREAAAETGAVLVDMNAVTTKMLAQLGPRRARRLFRWLDPGEHPNHPDGIIDATHFNDMGAREVARRLAECIAETPGLPQDMADPQQLDPGTVPVPAVLAEFTVSRPELALTIEPGVADTPVFTSPAPGRIVGAARKLTGKAPAGTDYVLFFEEGRYLGGTAVSAAGTWQWRRVVNWPGGPHKVEMIGLAGNQVSRTSSVDFQVLDRLDAPQIVGPRPNAWCGPRPRFSGTAAPGVEKVMVLEQGRLIAEAPVQEDGTWRVTHAHDWRPGTYTVEFVSVFSAIHSAPTPLTLRVHGIPEDSWLHSSLSSREPCSGTCEHYPAMPVW